MNIRTFSIGGVHPEENKLSNDAVTQVAALPKQAIFPLSQHIGAPAKPVVAKGDKVKVGTLIAEAGGFVSAPIYSSVSGTVFKIDTAIDATGYRKPVIIINVEGDECQPHQDRWCRRYGWCLFPDLYQTDTSADGKGRVRNHQCRRVRALHHSRLPSDDGASR